MNVRLIYNKGMRFDTWVLVMYLGSKHNQDKTTLSY